MKILKPIRILTTVAALALGPASGLFAAGDLKSARPSPNPARVFIGDNEITFNNVTDDVKIRIYSASGALVRDMHVEASGGTAAWDLKNENGEAVASGVYVCLLTNSAGEKKTIKVAVIR
jgi:flagellar hook assembly protein FlgD